MINVANSIQKVIDVLRTRDWSQGSFFRDYLGEPCQEESAVSCCLLGASMIAFPDDCERVTVNAAIYDALGSETGIAEWNDRKVNSKEEVIAKLFEIKRSIEERKDNG